MNKLFWAKVNKTKTCWLWTACIQHGYGLFGVKGKSRKAHRVLWEHLNGRVPKGMCLDHLCRVRHCVNPAHLEAVDFKTNILRGEGLAAQKAKQVLCIRGHELSGKNLYYRPSRPTHRICRKCREDNVK